MLRSPASPWTPSRCSSSRASCSLCGELAPVGHDLRPVAALPRRDHVPDVVLRADVRAGVLVHEADAGRSGGGERGVDVAAPVRGADALVEGGARRVVRLARHQPGVAPAGQVARARGGGQRRGDHRGVAVDAGHVDHPAVRRTVQLGRGEGAPLGPAGLVPGVHVQRAALSLPGAGLHPAQRHGEGRCVQQVDPGEALAGLGQVHVRVHERGGDQRTVELDDLVDRRRRAPPPPRRTRSRRSRSR